VTYSPRSADAVGFLEQAKSDNDGTRKGLPEDHSYARTLAGVPDKKHLHQHFLANRHDDGTCGPE
jgi:hypothetical protein